MPTTESVTNGYRDFASTVNTVSDEASNEFNLDDFYALLAAQLQNQDLYNAQDDTKFLEQMVQIYNIQNMKEMSNVMAEMNAMNLTSYAFEFMGKDVKVASYNKDNELVEVTGTVEKVVLYDGEPKIYVNGEAYGLGNVMEVYPVGTGSKEDDSESVESEE